MKDYNAASRHIAVLAFPMGTHAAPLLSFIRQISTAAPDLTFSFFSTAESNASTFPTDSTLDKIKTYDVWNGLPKGYVFKGNHAEPAEYFVKALPGNFREAMDKVTAETGKRFDCLVTDAFYWFGADMAAEMQIPWVPLWTSGPRALLIHVETDKIRRHLGIEGDPEKTLDFLPDFSMIRASDLPDGVVLRNVHSPFAEMLHKMGLALPRATAVAANSFEELDPIITNMLKSRFRKFLNIGPFCRTLPPSFSDSHGCIEWLHKQEPASVAYISFGSVVIPPPHELAALAEALEDVGSPYLWSFRGDPEKLLPKEFVERSKERGKIVPWAPQLKVLEHPSVGVFITHCGWNSVLESMVGGVPLIVRPFFGEQNLNNRFVEAVWGMGLGVEGGILTKDVMVKALKLILSTEEGEKMRKKIGVHKELALKAVEPNGSTTKNFENLVKIISNH
ncbi:hypothetical protein SLE2022_150980 [Rubroshorea leprosula]